jgi:hypothetical protein
VTAAATNSLFFLAGLFSNRVVIASSFRYSAAPPARLALGSRINVRGLCLVILPSLMRLVAIVTDCPDSLMFCVSGGRNGLARKVPLIFSRRFPGQRDAAILGRIFPAFVLQVNNYYSDVFPSHFLPISNTFREFDV